MSSINTSKTKVDEHDLGDDSHTEFKRGKRYLEDFDSPSVKSKKNSGNITTAQTNSSSKKTGKLCIESVGLFTKSGRFYFKDLKEIQKIHKYYQML